MPCWNMSPVTQNTREFQMSTQTVMDINSGLIQLLLAKNNNGNGESVRLYLWKWYFHIETLVELLSEHSRVQNVRIEGNVVKWCSIRKSGTLIIRNFVKRDVDTHLKSIFAFENEILARDRVSRRVRDSHSRSRFWLDLNKKKTRNSHLVMSRSRTFLDFTTP